MYTVEIPITQTENGTITLHFDSAEEYNKFRQDILEAEGRSELLDEYLEQKFNGNTDEYLKMGYDISAFEYHFNEMRIDSVD